MSVPLFISLLMVGSLHEVEVILRVELLGACVTLDG